MNEDTSVVSGEFRHEVVERFVKGWTDGQFRLHLTHKVDMDKVSTVVIDTNGLISKYVSGNLQGEELARLEQEIFERYCHMVGFRMLEEPTPNAVNIDERIERLDARIASTNKLLLEILTYLKGLEKKIDNLGKS